MKINKLTISNFAGIKEEKFNFDGKDAKIYGNNATGKTTTATALQWLLSIKVWTDQPNHLTLYL